MQPSLGLEPRPSAARMQGRSQPVGGVMLEVESKREEKREGFNLFSSPRSQALLVIKPCVPEVARAGERVKKKITEI